MIPIGTGLLAVDKIFIQTIIDLIAPEVQSYFTTNINIKNIQK